MNILIVDDAIENISAAQKAARSFSNDDFYFASFAEHGMRRLDWADAVVTDLFFLPEGHSEEDSLLHPPYMTFRDEMWKVRYKPAFKAVAHTRHYNGDIYHASADLLNAIALVNFGSKERALNNLTDYLEGVKVNVANPEFPYGAALMLAAKEKGKRHLLLTDIHRHARSNSSASSSVSGLVLLLQLIEAEIMTVEEVEKDGGPTYLASDRINKIAGETSPAKTSPAVWAEAIRLVTA